MPTKSGASHSMSALVALVLGSLISEYLIQVAPPLGTMSVYISSHLENSLGVPIPADPKLIGTAVIMAALAFTWGVVYHFRRHT